jgi:hypothetical protein
MVNVTGIFAFTLSVSPDHADARRSLGRFDSFAIIPP